MVIYRAGLSNLLAGELTEHMEHSPSWIANCLTIQEIYFSLRNRKFHYRVQKSPRLVHLLNQLNPACILPMYFFKIYFNIILSSILRYSKWSSPSGFPIKTVYAFLAFPYACYPPRPSYHPWRDHLNVWCWVQIIKLLTVLFTSASCYFLSSRPKCITQGPTDEEFSPSLFFLYYQRPAFTLIQCNRQSNISLQCYAFYFKKHTVKMKYSRSVGS